MVNCVNNKFTNSLFNDYSKITTANHTSSMATVKNQKIHGCKRGCGKTKTSEIHVK